MENRVNYLSGKDWLRNAINIWSYDKFSIEEIKNRFFNFCYKDRTKSGYIDDILNYDSKKEYDYSFSYIKSINSLKTIFNIITKSAYNSYHIVFLDNDIINGIFLFPYIIQNLISNNIEYRGKIVININEGEDIKFALMFLNRNEIRQEYKEIINILNFRIKYNKSKEFIINSKSKIDKIGLLHPAPYSYIDINKLCELENIKNKTILDPFLGVGSTILGSYQNNYNIGIELNGYYVNLIQDRFTSLNMNGLSNDKYEIITGDSLKEVNNIKKRIDVVITSPPYFSILKNKTSGVRTDGNQSRQGIQYYSDSNNDIGNIEKYEDYIDTMQSLFKSIKNKMNNNGVVYMIISDFTVNKKEKDVHSDFVLFMNKLGFEYNGTSYFNQTQKVIYPFGYPYKIVLNHVFQYVIKFTLREKV